MVKVRHGEDPKELSYYYSDRWVNESGFWTHSKKRKSKEVGI